MGEQEPKPCPFCEALLEWCSVMRGFTHPYDPFCVASGLLVIGNADMECWNTRARDPMLEELAGALEEIARCLSHGLQDCRASIIAKDMLGKYQQSKVQP